VVSLSFLLLRHADWFSTAGRDECVFGQGVETDASAGQRRFNYSESTSDFHPIGKPIEEFS
jgi:hypothetical protein